MVFACSSSDEQCKPLEAQKNSKTCGSHKLSPDKWLVMMSAGVYLISIDTLVATRHGHKDSVLDSCQANSAWPAK